MAKIYDNGGATFDRYTIVTNGAIITMSDRPRSPSGVNQFSHQLGEGETYEPNNNEREIELQDAPVEVLIALIERLEAM